MSKTLPLIFAALTAMAPVFCAAQSAAPGVPPRSESARPALMPLDERAALIGRLGTRGGYTLGLDPGTSRSFNPALLLDRYLPLVNELSSKTGTLISFVPETNVKAFQRKAAAGQYPFIFVNAEIAASAAAAGYIPLVRRSANVVSVVLTLSGSRIQKIQDLGGVRLGVNDQGMAYALARSTFTEARVAPVVERAGSSGDEDLLRILDSQQVEGVILQEDTANSALARFAGKYRILARMGTAPGYILMAHPTVPILTREAARLALLNLRPTDAVGARILRGIDGKTPETGFEIVSDEEMSGLIRLFNLPATDALKTPTKAPPPAPARTSTPLSAPSAASAVLSK